MSWFIDITIVVKMTHMRGSIVIRISVNHVLIVIPDKYLLKVTPNMTTLRLPHVRKNNSSAVLSTMKIYTRY